MFRVIFLIFVAFAASHAAKPTVQISPPVACGYLPNTIYTCIGAPKIFKPEISRKCNKDVTECEKMACLFSKSGWIKGNIIDKDKVKSYFDTYAKENPQWTVAVEAVKTSCLSTDLPSQGIFLNCPAYDIMICTYSSFMKVFRSSSCMIKHSFNKTNLNLVIIATGSHGSFNKENTQPDQWAKSETCEYPRQFAAACPYCPSDCFSPQVPIGSCNACLTLPRSP